MGIIVITVRMARCNKSNLTSNGQNGNNSDDDNGHGPREFDVSHSTILMDCHQRCT